MKAASRLPRRTTAMVLAGTTALWFAAWLAFPLADGVRTAALNVLWTVVALAGGAAAIVAIRDPRNERLRGSLAFLGAGAIAWGLGQLVWTYHETIAGTEPYPSFADAGYLAALPLLAAGVLAWPHSRPRFTRRQAFDTLVITTVVAAYGWHFVVAPIAAEGVSTFTDALGLVYPVADLMVLAAVAVALFRDDCAERGRLGIVGLGLITLVIADTAFALTVPQGLAVDELVNPGWTIPFAAIGAAALLPPGFGTRRVQRLASPGIAAVVTLLVVALAVDEGYAEWREHGGVGSLDTIAIGLVLVLLVVYSLRLASMSARRSRELEAAHDRERSMRARFVAELVSAQEAEARRIAGLLHDDAVQQLTALGFQLELQAKRSGDAELTAIAQRAGRVTASIRQLLVELHPAVLESQGLAAAVEVAAESLRNEGVDVHVSPLAQRLPIELEAVVYRTVQEAFANVAKHARASRVDVHFTFVGPTLRCRIRDDGLGFDLSRLDHAATRGHLGLQIMRERIDLVGGRLLLEANPGRGTTLVVDVPSVGVPSHEKAVEARA